MSIELNRSAFEAFAQSNEFGTYRTDRKGDGYDSSHTQLMWMAWCAAIQQAESEPVARPAWWMRETPEGIEWTDVEPWIDGYTPLYTHPAPGVPDDVARDAERYRWLRNSLPAGQGSLTVLLDDRRNGCFNKPLFMGQLDAAIDAAMLAASTVQKVKV